MNIIYLAGWTSNFLISRIICRMKIKGLEHFPKEGGYLIATNHLSYFDPAFLANCFYHPIYFLAKKELFRNFFLKTFFHYSNSMPVKRGVIDRSAIAMCVKAVNDGKILTIFPEGTRDKSGEFLPPKPGIGMIAKQLNCKIIPGYIHGSNRIMDCIFRRDQLSVTFGEPFESDWVDQFPADKSGYVAISHAIMDKIKALKADTVGKS